MEARRLANISAMKGRISAALGSRASDGGPGRRGPAAGAMRNQGTVRAMPTSGSPSSTNMSQPAWPWKPSSASCGEMRAPITSRSVIRTTLSAKLSRSPTGSRIQARRKSRLPRSIQK